MNNPIDRSLLVARLATLKSEYSSGRQLLADLDARATTLREQLLRINGAAQVLEELLHASDAAPTPATTATQHGT